MRPIPLRSWLTGLLVAVPLGYILFFPQLLRCQTIDYSPDFKRITDSSTTIYVSRATPQKDQHQLVSSNQRATQRLREFWQIKSGKQLQGKAILIYCHTDAQYQQVCGGMSGVESSAGCSLGTPWGESFLVLGPEGNNADVIAHERCHDELFARLGWWRTKRQIPQWFNEGLALMVDYRFTSPTPNPVERYRELHNEWQFRAQSGQIVIGLDHLETTRNFFNGNYYHVLLAYLTSATEVARWLVIARQPGLVQLTEQIRNGEDFETAYKRLGQKRRP